MPYLIFLLLVLRPVQVLLNSNSGGVTLKKAIKLLVALF